VYDFLASPVRLSRESVFRDSFSFRSLTAHSASNWHSSGEEILIVKFGRSEAVSVNFLELSLPVGLEGENIVL